MSSYQGGRGGQGRGGCGARGGDLYANQGRGRGANSNWRGPHPQHPAAGYTGPLGGGHNDNQGRRSGANSNWREQHPQYPAAGYTGPLGADRNDNQGRGSGANSNWREQHPQHLAAGYAGPLSGRQYDNQGRGSGANPNWRGPPPEHTMAGNAGRANTGQYLNSDSTPQYLQQRGPQGDSTPRGPGPLQMHVSQGSGAHNQYQRAPQEPRWTERGHRQIVGAVPARFSAPMRGDQVHGRYTDTLHHVHQATQVMQTLPQATDGVLSHGKDDADLECQMSVLTLQPMTPPSSVIKFVRRPGKGTRGQRVVVRANHFLVQLSDKELHHYDVLITPTALPGTNRVVMQTLVKEYQQSHLAGRLPVYDGNNRLYTAGPLPFNFQSFQVTLSDENRPQREKVFKVDIKHVGSADMRDLQMFLISGLPDAPLDAIQALDIVLREHASNSNHIVPVGRSFFSDSFGNHKLGDGLEGWQGFYKSLRITQMGLSLNLDIMATAFIEPILVSEFVSKLIGKDLNNSRLTNADILKIKRNLKGVKVEVTHRGSIRRKHRISGLTALATKDLTFTSDKSGTKKTVVDYFMDAYGHNIRYINIPCLDVGNNSQRQNYLPMEVCKIVKGQRYKKNLNENQITNLLRATCQKPADRENSILNTVRDNMYNEDIFANEFGLTVSEHPTTIEARVLPPPLLKYHNTGAEKECMPRFGAWNMRDKKLVNGGKVKFWFCISFSPTIRANDAGWFCKKLGDMCRVSGMEFAPNPILPPIAVQGDRLEAVLKSRYEEAVNALSRQDNHLPDLLIVILPNSNGSFYSNLKRICETDIGLVTQCCLMKHVAKASPQFLSNLALKINVKVGGRNTVLADAVTRQVPVVSRMPTIIFGADVSHPPPGEDTNPSIAAVVASQDWPEITTYAGAFRAQAHRQEIISHLGDMVKEHLVSFRRKTNLEPKQIIFYRDGVSESQFQQVSHYEINAIKNACKQLHPNYVPAITFIVVQKRHHTRFFPADSRNMDRSGNVLPGTVIDLKICHPTEFDFYLCSHAGIQGTSHPAHYHVLCDDNGFSVDQLQMLTYNLCYTYARCTRSVSIAPPAYYAHQIAYRARSYLDSRASDSESYATSSSAGRGETSSATVKQLPSVKDNVKEVMFYC